MNAMQGAKTMLGFADIRLARHTGLHDHKTTDVMDRFAGSKGTDGNSSTVE
jgi:hypothetical protein